MNIFEPLFLLLVMIAAGTFITAGVFALRGQPGRAGRTLRRLASGAAVYFAVVIAVSIVTPPREFHPGDQRCFDDWCITVAAATRLVSAHGAVYDVSLRLSNRAKRVPMGEKGTVVYLVDSEGHRYDPEPDPSAVPLDTRIPPGDTVLATRRFSVPRDAKGLGLVYTHEGGFPIGWLIVSEGGWFQRPSVVRLD